MDCNGWATQNLKFKYYNKFINKYRNLYVSEKTENNIDPIDLMNQIFKYCPKLDKFMISLMNWYGLEKTKNLLRRFINEIQNGD